MKDNLFVLMLVLILATLFADYRGRALANKEIGRDFYSRMEQFDERTRFMDERNNQTSWKVNRVISILNTTVYKGNMDLMKNDLLN